MRDEPTLAAMAERAVALATLTPESLAVMATIGTKTNIAVSFIMMAEEVAITRTKTMRSLLPEPPESFRAFREAHSKAPESSMALLVRNRAVMKARLLQSIKRGVFDRREWSTMERTR